MRALITFLFMFIFVFISSITMAGGLSYAEKKKLKKAGYSKSDIRKIQRGKTNVTPTYKYESISGNRYKYDLSKPGDRFNYKMDIGAQLDDKINMKINPKVKMDRNFKQYGGGLQR